MKIHQCTQGSPEWHSHRARNFTASELGPFALEPVKITLTVDEIKAELDARGIARKGLTKRDDLLAILPGKEAYAKLCQGARTAIIGKIHAGRMLALRQRDPLTLSIEEQIILAREDELDAKQERDFKYNIPVKYGKILEPFARSFYESKTGYEVEEVGFIEHDSGGFGCSPDGMVKAADGTYSHGVEIKNLLPTNHLDYLLDGVLPGEFEYQCHTGMAVTGLNRWDLLLFCPGDAPLLIQVERDDFTFRLGLGLKQLVIEKQKIKQQLAALWQAEYGKAAA